MLTCTVVVTVVLEGELRAPEPGDPGDPGEPGLSEADEGELDRLVLVEPEKESLKLGFCLPDKLDFPRTSFSSVSFTIDKQKLLFCPLLIGRVQNAQPSLRTLLSLHELAYGFHEVLPRLHLIWWRNHCLTILKVILICIEPHLLFILQSPCISTKAMVPQDGAHAGEDNVQLLSTGLLLR